MSDRVKFAFKRLNDKGREIGAFSSKGVLESDQLTLGKLRVPLSDVVQVQQGVGKLLLVVLDGQRNPVANIVHLRGANDERLFTALNRACSGQWAEKRREALAAQGKAGIFRAAPCGCCQATIDLSGHPASEQVYCPYCESLSPAAGPAAPEDRGYRLCEQCTLFAKPTVFTTFYFYFLIAVYGFRWKQARMCNTCMRSEAWKMLAFNAPFILGLAVAIPQLVRAYAGGSALSKTYAGLDRANALSKKRKTEAAVNEYTLIETRLGRCAGVRLNHGLTLLNAGRVEDAAGQFMGALEDCANYEPAARMLALCYQKLGMTQELKALEDEWKQGVEPAATAAA
jgi:hypothetical protein